MVKDNNKSCLSNLGSALKLIRFRRARKQVDVAIDARISKTHLSEIENNKVKPSIEVLDRLLSELNCDLIELQRTINAFYSRQIF